MSANEPEVLRERTFRGRSLRASRFVSCDLADVVVRGSDVSRMEIDDPWLLEGGNRLLVNGVDVVPFVEAELSRRFPGRELRTAEDPEGLGAAWSAVEQAWAASVERAMAMPAGSVDASVFGEWSFAQTLRHLVMATDTWLGKAILGEARPYHPAGLPNDDSGTEAYGPGTFTVSEPSFEEVLEVRAERQAMVRDFIDGVSTEVLGEERPNPHDPRHRETVLSCLRTILEEEWEHHRYAVRDLDALAGSPNGARS